MHHCHGNARRARAAPARDGGRIRGQPVPSGCCSRTARHAPTATHRVAAGSERRRSWRACRRRNATVDRAARPAARHASRLDRFTCSRHAIRSGCSAPGPWCTPATRHRVAAARGPRPRPAGRRDRHRRRPGPREGRGRLRGPAALPARGPAAPHRVEGLRPRPGPAHQAVRGHRRRLARLRLGQPAGPRRRGAAFAAVPLGARRHASGEAYGLRLPGVAIEANIGSGHAAALPRRARALRTGGRPWP